MLDLSTKKNSVFYVFWLLDSEDNGGREQECFCDDTVVKIDYGW